MLNFCPFLTALWSTLMLWWCHVVCIRFSLLTLHNVKLRKSWLQFIYYSLISNETSCIIFRQRKELCKCSFYLKFNSVFFVLSVLLISRFNEYEKCFSSKYLDYCLLSDYWFSSILKGFHFSDLIRIADDCLLTDTTCIVQTLLVVINGNEFKPENIEYHHGWSIINT